METLFIVIPAYNEQENIEPCVRDWYPVLKQFGDMNFQIIVVNDGSTDETGAKLKLLNEKYQELIPLHKVNGGHGSAVLYGYRYAIESGADWIFQTDSDGQTNPAEFKQFWEKRNEYDAILGNRVVRGDGKDRKVIENIVCFLLRLFFGVRIEDANAPFRLMKTSLVTRYIDKLPPDYNIPNIMFTTYFVYFREKLIFLPISFKSRKNGKNSINLRRIMKIGLKAIIDFGKLKREIDD